LNFFFIFESLFELLNVKSQRFPCLNFGYSGSVTSSVVGWGWWFVDVPGADGIENCSLLSEYTFGFH
jgi:hypothetical protein